MEDNRLRAVFLRTKLYLFFFIVLIMSYLLIINFDSVYQTIIQHPITINIAIILNATALALQAHSFLQLLPKKIIKPTFIETYQTWASANLTNYLGPLQPGLAVRAAFFKLHNIPVKLTLLVTLKQLTLSMWLALGFSFAGVLSGNQLIQTLSLIALIFFVFLPLALKKLRYTNLSKYIEKISSNAAPTPRQLLLIAGQYLVSTLNIYFVYTLFNADMAFHEAALLSVIFALSSLLSLTPNNLGVQEAILAYAAHIGGLSAVDAISIALVFRLGHIIACFLILLAAAYFAHDEQLTN